MVSMFLAVVAIMVALAALWVVSDAGRKMETENKAFLKGQATALQKEITKLNRANDDLAKRIKMLEGNLAEIDVLRTTVANSNRDLTKSLQALHNEILVIENAIPPRKLEAMRAMAQQNNEDSPASVS